MSLELIRKVFENITCCEEWSVQLLQIETSVKSGIGYSSRKIVLSPSSQLASLINDISMVYLGKGRKTLATYQNVRDYDGTADALTIYRLPIDSALINAEYTELLSTIANPNTEDDPFEYKSAYLLNGEVTLDNDTVPVKMISMQRPITKLKHKYCHNKGTFTELTDKIISLRPTMDILVVDKTVYFLTLAGENLFNMARAYKAVCIAKVAEVEAADFIHGIDIFKAEATSGHNPRRFVSYDENNLLALQKKSMRQRISKEFSIPMDSNRDKFDATIPGVTEKIVKLLCNKGMLHPFEKNPVEVSGAIPWR